MEGIDPLKHKPGCTVWFCCAEDMEKNAPDAILGGVILSKYSTFVCSTSLGNDGFVREKFQRQWEQLEVNDVMERGKISSEIPSGGELPYSWHAYARRVRQGGMRLLEVLTITIVIRFVVLIPSSL